MKKKYSLLLLFLFISTPLFTIAFIPAHWWVLLNIVLFTVIITVTYNLEHRKQALSVPAQCGLIGGLVCFETVLWGCANFILTNTAISNTDTWQTLGALAGSGIAGIAAFAAIMTLLHNLQQKN
ncbi:hypothetical protein [Halodesulfovibrio spirochaetisodalis]|uniref:Uncharacterized protein n=1 Tax=Halodesulfovibrio spirochaetisodalis TaxID=1560234 RepID=A0A1B7X8S7_9BACT|nr:hypothetical protein [Halodesulfovibrio spirochaetisodalis]OBQ45747.1 hypothetical protein SP90_16400 [Halodesulfovibrio spirochaetisodalis]